MNSKVREQLAIVGMTAFILAGFLSPGHVMVYYRLYCSKEALGIALFQGMMAAAMPFLDAFLSFACILAVISLAYRRSPSSPRLKKAILLIALVGTIVWASYGAVLLAMYTYQIHLDWGVDQGTALLWAICEGLTKFSLSFFSFSLWFAIGSCVALLAGEAVTAVSGHHQVSGT